MSGTHLYKTYPGLGQRIVGVELLEETYDGAEVQRGLLSRHVVVKALRFKR